MSVALMSDAEIALAERLSIVREALGVGDLATPNQHDLLFASLLDLVRAVQSAASLDAAWLLVTGLTGAFPGADLVRSVQRSLAIKDPEDAVVWLLDACATSAIRFGSSSRRMRLVTDRPVVDVNVTARSDFLTGIQRVVRRVASEWVVQHDVELVVWTDRAGAYRSLSASERARLLGPDSPVIEATGESLRSGHEIVVPWGVPVVLTEVPPLAGSDRLAAMAEHTGASMRLIGYDCIPMSSAETVPLAEPEKFGRYLEVVKWSDRLAGISRTAATEFEGFVSALATQGLTGPHVSACPLPHTTSVAGTVDDLPTRDVPLVASIGTVGRRKNQVALVEAAELLWREGLEFEVRILGHLGSERSPLKDLVPWLRAAGRRLVVEEAVSDARIASTLAQARCLVFPSLHEGFGLPIVEALSHDVPVITSDFGSMREVAEGQGCLLVDPEDVTALAAALRSLLDDDEAHARLVAEARSRPVRTWTTYADELWTELLG